MDSSQTLPPVVPSHRPNRQQGSPQPDTPTVPPTRPARKQTNGTDSPQLPTTRPRRLNKDEKLEDCNEESFNYGDDDGNDAIESSASASTQDFQDKNAIELPVQSINPAIKVNRKRLDDLDILELELMQLIQAEKESELQESKTISLNQDGNASEFSNQDEKLDEITKEDKKLDEDTNKKDKLNEITNNDDVLDEINNKDERLDETNKRDETIDETPNKDEKLHQKVNANVSSSGNESTVDEFSNSKEELDGEFVHVEKEDKGHEKEASSTLDNPTFDESNQDNIASLTKIPKPKSPETLDASTTKIDIETPTEDLQKDSHEQVENTTRSETLDSTDPEKSQINSSESINKNEEISTQTNPVSSIPKATEQKLPSVPKSRPHVLKHGTDSSIEAISKSSTGDSTASKKAAPKVPKKPSSKIAAFQQMLEQQQQQDMGALFGKPKPQMPMKRPGVRNSESAEPVDEENKASNKEFKTPSRVNSKFAQNLNGIIGMPLPGIALGANPIAALKAAKSQDLDSSEKVSETNSAPDVRKGRARGPRGRRLPESVKSTVKVNDEALGNADEVYVHDLYTYSFKSSETSLEASEISKSANTLTSHGSLSDCLKINAEEGRVDSNGNLNENVNEIEIAKRPTNDNFEANANDDESTEEVSDSESSESDSRTSSFEPIVHAEDPIERSTTDIGAGSYQIVSAETTSNESIISTTTENDIQDIEDGSVLSESETSN